MKIKLGKSYKYFLDYDEGQGLFLVNEEESLFETSNGNVVFKKKSDHSRFYRAGINVFPDEEGAKNKADYLNRNITAEITCAGCISTFTFDNQDDDFHIKGELDNVYFFCPICGNITRIKDDTMYRDAIRGSHWKKEYIFFRDVAEIIKRKEMAKEAKEVRKHE